MPGPAGALPSASASIAEAVVPSARAKRARRTIETLPRPAMMSERNRGESAERSARSSSESDRAARSRCTLAPIPRRRSSSIAGSILQSCG